MLAREQTLLDPSSEVRKNELLCSEVLQLSCKLFTMKRGGNESRAEHFLSPFKPYHIFLCHLEFFSAVQDLWMYWDNFPFSIQLIAIKISKPHLFHLQNNYWSQFPDTQRMISLYCSGIHTNNMLYFLIEVTLFPNTFPKEMMLIPFFSFCSLQCVTFVYMATKV